jgi:hypothetical protein
MKTFKVHLLNGQVELVHADGYRRDGDQYVFDTSGSSEVQFFIVAEVTGITEATFGAQSVPRPPRRPLI